MNLSYKEADPLNSSHQFEKSQFHKPPSNITMNEQDQEKIYNYLEKLFILEQEEKYEEIQNFLVNVITKILAQNAFDLFPIFQKFPMSDLLLRLSQNPLLMPCSIHCISNLIQIQPEFYASQFLQFPDFFIFLFNEFNNPDGVNKESCFTAIYNLISESRILSELIMKNFDFDEFFSFAEISSTNTQKVLNLFQKMLKSLDLTKDFVINMIDFVDELVDLYRGIPKNRSIIFIKIIYFFIDLMSFQPILVTSIIDIFEGKIANFISDDNLIFISAVISFYTILMVNIEKIAHENPINEIFFKNYCKIVHSIFLEAPVSSIIGWINNFSPSECFIGYQLLAYLLLYQKELELNIIDEICQSVVVITAVTNITNCRFNEKMRMLNFIQQFIQCADPMILNEYHDLLFSMFEHLIVQSFDIETKKSLFSLMRVFVAKLSQMDRKVFQGIIENAEGKYNIIEKMNELKLDEENYDPNLHAHINTIINIMQLEDKGQ
ncbi:hypothetical protein TRFO_08823 [Tritrichomonas foetus]|uniref:Uncharacterized protein n=1 Tax=Tritrichomonas foetus TaxID=1144522 RepID=A0A1J4JLW5_9EUKA|nr:hypothetical protein TRFO_08823 [Tritrichomonas foetus]|eukprot:OHS98547.1 hypothetical protein TRFO_08823 [Tritrichomonas foetus]